MSQNSQTVSIRAYKDNYVFHKLFEIVLQVFIP